MNEWVLDQLRPLQREMQASLDALDRCEHLGLWTEAKLHRDTFAEFEAKEAKLLALYRAPVIRSQVGSPNRHKSHCPSGHAYEGTNLIIDKRGHRKCRECKRGEWKKKGKR